MATTIKVDGTVADFTWQDDQLLDKLADVDYCVDGQTATTPAIFMVPISTKGTGGDAAGSLKGATGVDRIAKG